MKSSNHLKVDIFDKFQFCQQFLKSRSKKKPWEPKLTPEEQILFDEEEILSPYQHIIANTCKQHRNRQQVVHEDFILALLYFHRSKLYQILHQLKNIFYLFIISVVKDFILEQ